MGEQYNNTTTAAFLQRLSQGKGMPGSGCAAAFSALMGISILQSVCKITLKKTDYTDSYPQLDKALQLLNQQYYPQLEVLMQQDADAVTDMLKNTITKELTTTPIAISKSCIDVLKTALEVFDNTYQPMLGDSATAIAMINSAINATLFISKANTRKNNTLKSEVERIEEEYLQLKHEVSRRQII
ncbi:MAG: cyclodeaminase/cyclohydrolase family protein [Flavipsychrobacter sp.]